MAQAHFSVTYEGPALADGRMPVRDLAPALLALGDLFTEASQVAYPDQEPVALDIKATGDGSFNVFFVVHGPDLWDQLVHFFTSKDVTAIQTMIDYVVGASGLFFFIKRVRGRRIEKQEPIGAGQVRVTLNDGTTIEVPAEVVKLYGRVTIRKKARETVRPVGRRGVDRLDFKSEGETTVSIEAEDATAFEVEPGESEVVAETTAEKVWAILSVVFTEGNKWRFTDGDARFAAAIEDETFLARVHQGEPFREGDTLRCHVREVQIDRDGKPRTDRFVVEVIEHVQGGTQLPLAPADELDPPDQAS